MQCSSCTQPNICNNEDDRSSTDSGCYRPGFKINYNGDSSSCSGSEIVLPSGNQSSTSKAGSTAALKSRSSPALKSRSTPDLKSRSAHTLKSSAVASTSRTSTTVDRELIKDRCRVAFGSAGVSFIVEGHGKIK